MLHELTEWLDLHVAFLEKQDGTRFLRQLRRTYQSLVNHPQLGPILGPLRAEASELESAFNESQRRAVEVLVTLKAEVVHLDPPSQELHATPPGPNQVYVAHWTSFAVFDRIVADNWHPVTTAEQPTRAHYLALILRRRLEQLQYSTVDANGESTFTTENLRPVFNPVARRLVEEEKRLWHAWHVIENERASHPGFALVQLDQFIASMLLGPEADPFMDPLLDQEENLVRQWVAEYRTLVERIHQELRLRLGTRRSMFALLERFRGRCQWHERAELHTLANSRGGKPEDKLVSIMARWLYDQGLSPLGQASAGGLRPDLFDPSRRPAVYIEAKQYRKAPLATIKKAIGQVDSTAAQFTAEPYAIREAFLAVFRLDGPLTIPQTLVVQRGTYTLYLVVIDLKPITMTGSRERGPAVQLTEALVTDHRAPSETRRRSSLPNRRRT